VTEYPVGARVRVEFDGEIANYTSLGTKGHNVAVRRDNGFVHSVRPEDVAGILEPSNWPPQVGDIWNADGKEFYVRADTIVPDSLVAASFDGLAAYWLDTAEDVDDFKALNPTLVRRR
jgi:hypothetical protein